jgi:hypothetical protein
MAKVDWFRDSTTFSWAGCHTRSEGGAPRSSGGAPRSSDPTRQEAEQRQAGDDGGVDPPFPPVVRTPLPTGLDPAMLPSSLGDSGKIGTPTRGAAQLLPRPPRPFPPPPFSVCAATYHKRCARGSVRLLQVVLVCTTGTFAYRGVLHMRFGKLLETI